MQTKRFRAAILTLLACGSVALACSDDDENPGTPTPAGAAGTAAGASGSSGTGGSGGSTAGTGGTGVAGAPTMMCGTETCTGLPGIPILAPNGIAACCVGPAMDKCGIDGTLLGMGCVEKNAPGNPDDTCFANDGGSMGGGGLGGRGGSGGSSDAATPDASGDDASTSDAGSDDASGGTAGASGAGGSAGGLDGGGGRGGLPVRGCCKPNGVCGILLNIPGLELGCVEIPQTDGGPAPQMCTPSGS